MYFLCLVTSPQIFLFFCHSSTKYYGCPFFPCAAADYCSVHDFDNHSYNPPTLNTRNVIKIAI